MTGPGVSQRLPGLQDSTGSGGKVHLYLASPLALGLPHIVAARFEEQEF